MSGDLSRPRAVVVVVAKAPVLGQVKTRLCPPLSVLDAARLASAALLDTLHTALEAAADSGGGRPVVALLGDISAAVGERQLRSALASCAVIPQRGADLASRLANAHADAGQLRPAHATLQLGMDTPQLRAADLLAAADVLAVAHAVLGPAADGGWWLLGLRDPSTAQALTSVPMSTTSTGRRTCEALRRAGLQVAALPVQRDVDTIADVHTVASLAPDSRFAAAVAGLPLPASNSVGS